MHQKSETQKHTGPKPGYSLKDLPAKHLFDQKTLWCRIQSTLYVQIIGDYPVHTHRRLFLEGKHIGVQDFILVRRYLIDIILKGTNLNKTFSIIVVLLLQVHTLHMVNILLLLVLIT